MNRFSIKDIVWAILPFLPLAVLAIPRGFTMMSEPNDPWYTPYTSIPWLISAAYVLPSTLIAVLLRVKVFSSLHFILMGIYAATIAYIVFRIRHRDESKPPAHRALWRRVVAFTFLASVQGLRIYTRDIAGWLAWVSAFGFLAIACYSYLQIKKRLNHSIRDSSQAR